MYRYQMFEVSHYAKAAEPLPDGQSKFSMDKEAYTVESYHSESGCIQKSVLVDPNGRYPNEHRSLFQCNR